MIPQSVASFAALAGFVTAIKSAWELSRMVRDKRHEVITEYANHASRELTTAYLEARMSRESFMNYDDELWDAFDKRDSMRQHTA